MHVGLENSGPGQKFDRDFCSMRPLLCLWDHKSVDTRVSPKLGTHLARGREGQANGCRYFSCKEKTQKKSNDTGTERRPENTQAREKGERKSIGHKSIVCRD